MENALRGFGLLFCETGHYEQRRGYGRADTLSRAASGAEHPERDGAWPVSVALSRWFPPLQSMLCGTRSAVAMEPWWRNMEHQQARHASYYPRRIRVVEERDPGEEARVYGWSFSPDPPVRGGERFLRGGVFEQLLRDWEHTTGKV